MVEQHDELAVVDLRRQLVHGHCSPSNTVATASSRIAPMYALEGSFRFIGTH
jgi:hypothetical protein